MQYIALLAGTYIMYIHRPEPCGPASGSLSFISAIPPSCQFYQRLSFPHRVTRLPSCRGLVPFVLPWSSPHPLTYYTPPSVHLTISSPPYLLYTPPQCVQQISMLWPATSSWVAMGKSAKEEIRGLHRMAGQRDGERGSIDERW